MKRNFTILLFIFLFPWLSFTQTDYCPEATVKAKQNNYYGAALEATQCATRSEIDAKTGPNPELNYRKALDSYLRAADYYNQSNPNFKAMTAPLRKQALEKAQEIHKLMEDQKYFIPQKLTDKLNQLLSQEDEEPTLDDEPKKDQDDEVKAPPVNTNDQRLIFRTKDGIFSMGISPPFEVEGGKRSGIVMSNEEFMEAIQNQEYEKLKMANYAKYKIAGYQISIVLERIEIKEYQRALFKDECKAPGVLGDRTLERGTKRKVSGPANMCFAWDWNWEIDNPNQTKDDLTGDLKVTFILNDAFYTLSFGVRNFDKEQLQPHLQAMFLSFRYEGDGKIDPDCETKYKIREDLAFTKTWKLPHPSRNTVILQKPVLQRDKVPAAWEKSTQFLIDALKAKKSLAKYYKTYKGIREGEKLSALAKRIGWTIENDQFLDVEFLPVDPSEFKTGTFTNMVMHYLTSFKAAAKGISGLEGQISNMAVDLYWEIPYIEVKGLCIPRMICEKGEWKVDYDYLEFRELSVDSNKSYHAGNLKFLTTGEVTRELEKNFYPQVEVLEREMVQFESEEDKCRSCKYQLYEKFPRESDLCARLKAKIKDLELDIQLLEDEQKIRERELAEWKSQRKGEMERLNEEMSELGKIIGQKEVELAGLFKQLDVKKQLKKNYEAQSQLDEKAYQKVRSEIATLEGQISGLESEISYLEKLRRKKSDLYGDIAAKRITAEKESRIEEIKTEIEKLTKERDFTKKQLPYCN